MKEILFFKPFFKEVIWGGNKLSEIYSDCPNGNIGECWTISPLENGESIIQNGTFKGETLSNLYLYHNELFNDKYDKFPLLVKLIYANLDLSIQVHPDDEYALKNENCSGKNEFWYILDCNLDTDIIVGHNAKTKDELKKMIYDKRFDELLLKRKIKKGDFFQIDAGTIHAIKSGTMILEVQQSSDITYRLYDYDRLSNGKLRELHIEKSIDVIKCPYIESKIVTKEKIIDDALITTLIANENYTVKKISLDGNALVEMSSDYQLFTVIDGTGKIDGHDIKKGDNFILPNGYGDFKLEGKLEIITCYVWQMF